MTVNEAVIIWTTQLHNHAVAITAMQHDPDLLAAVKAEHARVAEVNVTRNPGDAVSCVITKDRHKILTAMLAAVPAQETP